MNQWIADVDQYGLRVSYTSTGSSDGRHQFLQGAVDFAASDIPFQSHPEDNSDPEVPKDGSYAYMPITAGGTSFMFNLTTSGGAQVTNLRLSGQNIAKIFTGVITNWDDPALAVDNPSLTLPNLAITPVVRQDSAGTTFQLTSWMISQYPTLWSSYCRASGRAPHCAATSYYPKSGHMVSQSGDLGVAGYVSQASAAGAIGYVNYSYALNARMPVVKMLNASGYFTLPTPSNVAVSLLKAQIETTNRDPQYYLTQKLDGVYTDTDPRTYPLSSYAYVILPTTTDGTFPTDKGKTLSAFAYYAMCHGQREMTDLGYAPLPLDLVHASFDQIKKIPGAVSQDINTCDNPTFQNGADTLASTAPMPPASDAQNPPAANGGGSNGGGGGPSGSASTDPPGTTPSASNPIIATVTDPMAGSITVTRTQGGLVSGPYRALPYGVQVSAPAASTASPISDSM